MLFPFFLITALSALSTSAQSAISYNYPRAALLFPSEDPFWKPPKNLSDYAPGDIIRSRRPPSELGFYGAKLNVDSAWQLLYRSAGVQGEPMATVVTVLIPQNADFGKHLSYQSEIDAPYDACAPSITLQRKYANVNNIASQYGEFWLVSAMQRGWVVSLPDYQGPQAIFGNGRLAGQAVLDGVRAVLNSNKITGVRRDAKSALWGYSGGSLGTNFAAELQPKYAPELNIVGAAMGGLPANFKNVIANNNKKVGAGFIIAGILGVAKAFPEVKSIVEKQLLPEKAEYVRRVEKQCVVPTAIQFAGKDAFENFKDGAKILEIPRVRKILSSLRMGITGVPKIPMYIYMARNDELLVYDDTAALAKKYCDKGATVHFVKESAGGHITVALVGAPAAMQYLIERFDGKPIEEKCTERTVVSSVIDPKAREVLGNILKDITSALLGKKLGPDA